MSLFTINGQWVGKGASIIALLCMASLSLFLQKCTGQEPQKSGESQRKQPNIIYIYADDLGYNDLGSYGQKDIRTPHLDQLADQGVRFTQHYAGSTVCAPSRSVLMTGFHTGRTPVRGNRPIFPEGQYPLTYSVTTLPRILSDGGYATGAFGKWGLGYPGSEGMPTLHGFDRFFGYLCQRRAHFYYPEYLYEDMKGVPLRRVILEGNKVQDDPSTRPGSGPAITAQTYAPDAIHQEVLKFVEENRNGPFFLYIPSLIPHASLEVPEEALAWYLDEDGASVFNEPQQVQTGNYTHQPKPKAAYAAMVSYLDMQVGQIMDKLEELGIDDNTLVIFSSDNGSYSEGGYHHRYFQSNAPLRGGKRALYEGGIRVPMIAAWPDVIEAGSVSHHISSGQDMLPTFAELAGLAAPSGIDGISMLPTLLGQGDQIQHDYLYWEFHEAGGLQAVRAGDWKAVRIGVRNNFDAPVELYNLAEDIGEESNLAGSYPDIVKNMLQMMEDSHVPSEVFRLFD